MNQEGLGQADDYPYFLALHAYFSRELKTHFDLKKALIKFFLV